MRALGRALRSTRGKRAGDAAPPAPLLSVVVLPAADPAPTDSGEVSALAASLASVLSQTGPALEVWLPEGAPPVTDDRVRVVPARTG